MRFVAIDIPGIYKNFIESCCETHGGAGNVPKYLNLKFTNSKHPRTKTYFT